MNIIDFFIGFLLMNAMPHFVLGTWGGRMFSAFGFGNLQNKAYGLLCFLISFGLFLYQYGYDGLLKNGFYVGACTILLIYFFTGHFWKKMFEQ